MNIYIYIILEYHKNYHENNKGKVLEYHKKYNEENKEMIKEKKEKYYQKTKEIQAEKAKQAISCECGCTVRKADISKHKKTRKHIELMKQKEEKEEN